jgi:hypothetical protein
MGRTGPLRTSMHDKNFWPTLQLKDGRLTADWVAESGGIEPVRLEPAPPLAYKASAPPRRGPHSWLPTREASGSHQEATRQPRIGSPLPDRYNDRMATEGEKPSRKRRWLQFSLRGLLVAMIVVGVGLGASAHLFRAPIVERGYHKNGVVAWEHQLRRDWSGWPRYVKSVRYYSTGQKSEEWHAGWTERRYWLPDGTRVPAGSRGFGPFQWSLAVDHDNGDGTFYQGQPIEVISEPVDADRGGK